MNIPLGHYFSSIDERNYLALCVLHEKMKKYYHNPQYHTDWIVNKNANWQSGTHKAQLRMCEYIPAGSHVLEVGCGDGNGKHEIEKRVASLTYFGLDLNPNLWAGLHSFSAARADELPFKTGGLDVVISMFVIEHLVFPARFLDEAWRVLRPGGCLLLLAPDFTYYRMPSERVGVSYGSGMEKLLKGNYYDALITLYDSRVRITFLRLMRLMRILQKGKYNFLIYTEPRCFHIPGFTPDCDAVYPVSPLEITNYLGEKKQYSGSEIFYKDRSVFGLLVTK